MTEQNTFAIAELQQKANDGDAQAQFDLALCYANGTDVEKNLELAFEWHKKAAEQGHVNAQFALGLYYLLSKGNWLGVCKQQIKALIDKCFNDKNITKHLWLFKLASNAHEYENVSLDPAIDLAVTQALAKKGTGGNDDFAFLWLKNAAKKNHAGANYWLGVCYQNGIGTEKNDGLAFESFKIAAEQGVADSQYLLACCYFAGTGIEKSGELGLQWCEKAAEQSQVNAQYRLSQYYFDEEDTEQNVSLAIRWLKCAAEQGMVEAEIRLANCYAQGHGIENDDVQAFHWYTKAAEKGHAESQYWLARYYLSGGILEQLDEWDRSVIESGPYEYWRNAYLEKGYERAFDWAEKAVANGCEEANLLLGFMYNYGIGISQDIEQAFEFFKKAEIEDRTGISHYFLAEFYALGTKLSSKDADLEAYHSERAKPEKVLQFYDIPGLLSRLDEKHQNNLLRLEIDLHLKTRNFDAARILAQKNQEIVDLKYINLTEQLSQKNEELLEKNAQISLQNVLLQEKDKELEDMMSMFAHKFRSPLDAIMHNTTHENQVKLYTEAAQTMRGLLNIFSIISTDADILKEKIKQDRLGSGRLATVFSKTLDMILLHLLSVSSAGAEKIQQHYMAYAKAHGQCDAQVSYKTWCEDYFELEQVLQAEWEQSFALLLNQSATLEQRLAWLEQHFFKLELIGFERADIQFKEYGVTESLLTILLNEILVNAFKYYSSASKQPVVLEWTEREGHQVLICRNPSIRSERDIIKGSNKGHVFLSTLARKTGSAFTKPMRQDDFVVEFGIPDELLISK